MAICDQDNISRFTPIGFLRYALPTTDSDLPEVKADIPPTHGAHGHRHKVSGTTSFLAAVLFYLTKLNGNGRCLKKLTFTG